MRLANLVRNRSHLNFSGEKNFGTIAEEGDILLLAGIASKFCAQKTQFLGGDMHFGGGVDFDV